MVSSYSSDALEYKLVNGIIEMKIEGERLPDRGDEFAHEFRKNAPLSHSDLIVFDIREAYHPLTEDEWAFRIEQAASLFQGFTLALVKRPDQTPESLALQKAHEARGGLIKIFSHPGDARDWLQNPLA